MNCLLDRGGGVGGFRFFNKKHINMDYELNIPVQMGSTYKS
jgi:hypothetical protein